MDDRYPDVMEKTPPQPRPRWVQVLGKIALMALPAAIILGLIFDATEPPAWVARAVAVTIAAIVVVAIVAALWLVVRGEDEGGPSRP